MCVKSVVCEASSFKYKQAFSDNEILNVSEM